MESDEKKLTTVYGDMVRSACTAYFRSIGLSGDQIQEIADKLQVSRSTVEAAVYKDKGGLDTYAAIFAQVHDIGKENLQSSLMGFLEQLSSSRPSKSYLKWQKVASKLTENRRLFWLSILDAAIEAERKFKSK
jgi:predicted DNA-binding protein YlxM (UPF0122 family)